VVPAARKFDWRALLRDFPNRRGARRVLATNLVPLAGVLLLGWQASVATVAFFADTFLTAAALAFVMSVHAVDETAGYVRGPSRWAGIIGIFLFVLPIVSLPVFVGGMFSLPFAGSSFAEVWQLLETERSIQLAFAGLIVLHAFTAVQWLLREDRRAVRDELREVFGLVVFKVLVLAILGAHLAFVFVLLGWIGQLLALLLIAAILTIGEVYRAEVLLAMGVDRKWHDECEHGKVTSSPAASHEPGDPETVSRAVVRRKRRRKGRSRSHEPQPGPRT